ncbi:hypothetical protein PR202_ga03449 [Eleusine coracana subsp. coracana]|uniref:Uncharacterized protein n=1 Tax=Eleusine coracana subsp. coracana TaxID=191504 RepID=A0AAV5BQE5_ELECO|nr:hypothetical protein PR202_ga03449 [Eleusine coracana subsp. coracana]
MAEEEERKRRVLVVGGSGYLGQHLLAALASACHGLDVAFTYNLPRACEMDPDAAMATNVLLLHLSTGS